MKKIVLIISLFVLVISHVNSQELGYDSISADIQKLVILKLDYEKFRGDINKKDSVLAIYKNQVSKIKKSPNIYLSHIRLALRKDSANMSKERLPYKNTGYQSLFDFDIYFIKKIDLYRVVRYSLFKRNDELLPENFRGLPVVDEKNYKKTYKSNFIPKPGELKVAIRFLLDSLSLTHKEKKEVRKAENAEAVIDIKDYLTEKGLSVENKEFAKWAFRQLTASDRDLNVNLLVLDAMYEPNRKNYVPKDKEPINPY